MELESYDTEKREARVIVHPEELVNAEVGMLVSPNERIREMSGHLPLFGTSESSAARFTEDQARLVVVGNIALAQAISEHPNVNADLVTINQTISSGLETLASIKRAKTREWNSL